MQVEIDECDYIFVYGSLRKAYVELRALGFNIQLSPPEILLRLGVHEGVAILNGYDVFDIGSYPGIRPSNKEDAVVVGDVFRITAEKNKVLHELDVYEACSERDPRPHEYIRKIQKVHLVNLGAVKNAYVYEYNWAVNDSQPISGGDYIVHLQQKLASTMS